VVEKVRRGREKIIDCRFEIPEGSTTAKAKEKEKEKGKIQRSYPCRFAAPRKY